METPDATMIRFGKALEVSQRGDREEARMFAGLWAQIGSGGDPFHRMSVTHAQDDVHDELSWDLEALEAARAVTPERAAQAGLPGPVAGLFPSLHLDLGEDYRKLGDLASARRHLELGQAAAAALGEDGYSKMIKGGLQALALRLSAG